MEETRWLSLLWLIGALLLVTLTSWRFVTGNRDWLAHVALWLAIVATLALVYRLFLGP